MKVIYNNVIPFSGFAAINLYGTIFARSEYKTRPQVMKLIIDHESIHTAQMKDFCKWLPVGGTIFYILYFFEWLYRLVTPPYDKAYKDISFEKEAARFTKTSSTYLESRPKFNQWKI